MNPYQTALAAAGCCFLVASCSQVGQFTAQDAAQAAKINPANAACYQGFGALGTSIGATTQPGVFSLVATDLELQALLANPACQPVELAVIAKVLHATPASPLIP